MIQIISSSIHLEGLIVKAWLPASFKRGSNSTPLNSGLLSISHRPKYSSVFFDFAFLKKPIVYSQFDKEQFFSGEHSYTKGYFSYEDNGFGPVCYDLDTTVEEMIKVIENDCANTEKYISRIEEFYEYFDENSCQRVYEAIRKL